MKTIFSYGANNANTPEDIDFSEMFIVVYVENGEGDFFVGDNVVSFKDGDLFFFNGRIASSFNLSTLTASSSTLGTSRIIAMIFDSHQIEKSLRGIPEAYLIKKFITYSDYGVQLSGRGDRDLLKRVEKIRMATGLHKMLSLYRLMCNIAKNKSVEVLSAKAALKCNHSSEEPKLRKIFDFIKENHRDTITLQQIASIANMSPTGFCRFFKSHGQKTFSQYLAEVRVESSCKMLRNDAYSISDCCYESGFNNLSNFNRHFKKNTGMSPSEYRLKAMESFAVEESC